MSGSTTMLVWKSLYQISPIYLTGSSAITGNASSVGGTSLMSLIPTDLLGLAKGSNLDHVFAHFIPLPNATLIDNQIATYPFANQAVAANALITQPLQISMKMVAPVHDEVGYSMKLSIMNSLRNALYNHCITAGTFTVLTPSYIYTNCILTKMHDVSAGNSTQAQHTWQLDFVQPLLTLEAATDATNTLISKLGNGGQVTGPSWTGIT